MTSPTAEQLFLVFCDKIKEQNQDLLTWIIDYLLTHPEVTLLQDVGLSGHYTISGLVERTANLVWLDTTWIANDNSR